MANEANETPKGTDAAGRLDGLVGPVAFSLFEDNGNIRMWSQDSEPVRKLANELKRPIVSLYPASDIEKLKECLEFCAKVLWKLDDGNYINTYGPEDIDDMQCTNLKDLAREAVNDAKKLLRPNASLSGASRKVNLDPVGCCSAYVKHTNDPCFFRLAGWYPASEHPECSICRRRHGLETIHECE